MWAKKKRPPVSGAFNFSYEQINLLFLRSDRQIMYIQVAGQALRVTGEDTRGMRSCMALCTLRLIFMPRMVAKGAIDLCVLACRLLPCVVDLRVAHTAGCSRRIRRIGYLQRSVDRMTLGTGCDFLTWGMRLMAIETGWDQPMGSMADIACDLGVLARELGQLFLRAWMALAACACQCGSHRHFFRGMGI